MEELVMEELVINIVREKRARYLSREAAPRVLRRKGTGLFFAHCQANASQARSVASNSFAHSLFPRLQSFG